MYTALESKLEYLGQSGVDQTFNLANELDGHYGPLRTKSGLRKLASLTLNEKIEIIALWEHKTENPSASSGSITKCSLGRFYGCDESTIRHVLKRKEHWKVAAGLDGTVITPKSFIGTLAASVLEGNSVLPTALRKKRKSGSNGTNTNLSEQFEIYYDNQTTLQS